MWGDSVDDPVLVNDAALLLCPNQMQWRCNQEKNTHQSCMSSLYAAGAERKKQPCRARFLRRAVVVRVDASRKE